MLTMLEVGEAIIVLRGKVSADGLRRQACNHPDRMLVSHLNESHLTIIRSLRRPELSGWFAINVRYMQELAAARPCRQRVGRIRPGRQSSLRGTIVSHQTIIGSR